ncbi:MAG: hypothetical protein KGN00_09315 [Chloroflexota bacterium]|nr:hypothetical protein [Chloroflexota bacterium]MDE3193871.1 hypothetical protein [Chloroflexota bacterium]
MLASVLAIASVPLFASVALAGPDWCDDGSPPPNDFGLQGTGGHSLTSPTSWLKSTSWSGPGYDRSIAWTLTGGASKGMETAWEHAVAHKPGTKGH